MWLKNMYHALLKLKLRRKDSISVFALKMQRAIISSPVAWFGSVAMWKYVLLWIGDNQAKRKWFASLRNLHTQTVREGEEKALGSGQNKHLREIYLNCGQNKSCMDLGIRLWMTAGSECNVTLLLRWPPFAPRSTHMKSMNLCIDFHLWGRRKTTMIFFPTKVSFPNIWCHWSTIKSSSRWLGTSCIARSKWRWAGARGCFFAL